MWNWLEQTWFRVYRQAYNPLYDEMPYIVLVKSYDNEKEAIAKAKEITTDGYQSVFNIAIVTSDDVFITYKDGKIHNWSPILVGENR